MPREIPYPTPGEILLEEFLKPMGITQYRLAKEIGVPQRRIGEIVAGKRAVTAGQPYSGAALTKGATTTQQQQPVDPQRQRMEAYAQSNDPSLARPAREWLRANTPGLAAPARPAAR